MAEQLLLRPENPSGRECRVYERHGCELPTACRPASAFASKESAWSAVIRDISIGGIRLVLRRRFEPGTGLAVELPGTDEPYTVLAKVVHVRPGADGGWTLGCKFISELSQNEVDRLLSAVPIEPEEPTELDPDERPAQTIRDLRLRLALPQGAVIECVIRRFKPAEEWPVAPGKIMDIRGGTADEPWTLNVRVTRCFERDDGWTLACELANPPRVRQLLRALARIDD